MTIAMTGIGIGMTRVDRFLQDIMVRLAGRHIRRMIQCLAKGMLVFQTLQVRAVPSSSCQNDYARHMSIDRRGSCFHHSSPRPAPTARLIVQPYMGGALNAPQ
eukprot:GHVU01224003.1.p2 GENE.GHVU01224003.1~~GHVU01224003.1.p2  ORF type:complete len:103 (+),score=1.00 GHVU01224003.1:546-854(+)